MFTLIIPVTGTISKEYILIDPGHGGMDPGCNIGDIKESDIVLEISYKIKEVFFKIFANQEKFATLKSGNENYINGERNNFTIQISVKEKMNKQERLDEIAQKLLNYELIPSELTDKEVDEMTEWFTQDIKEKDKELEKIKNHILSIKRQIEDL